MNPWVLVGLGLNAAVFLMAFTWLICRWLNNAGYVDVAWAYGFTLVAGIYAALGAGAPLRKTLIVAMAAIWSLRLGTHLLVRVSRHHPKEDERYASLREQFPKRVWLMFFGFFQLQAVLIGLLSTPFAIACANPRPDLHPWEIAGVILWLIGIGGEALSDHQLNLFRTNPANQGRVCDSGLWNYSRHPNYFFEWVIWIAFFVFALGSPGGWVAIYCPLLMLYFLTKVTGIPRRKHSLSDPAATPTAPIKTPPALLCRGSQKDHDRSTPGPQSPARCRHSPGHPPASRKETSR